MESLVGHSDALSSLNVTVRFWPGLRWLLAERLDWSDFWNLHVEGTELCFNQSLEEW